MRVAKKNVKKFGITNRVKLVKSSFTKFKSKNKFDIIVSNPPYIAHGDMRVNAGAKHDPEIALYAKNNGLAAYEQIAKNAKNLLKQNGKIYLEIGAGQSAYVLKIFESCGFRFERVVPDLSGINRVLVFSI